MVTFLPIVERELCVAARKRGTSWLRVAAGLVALLIGGGCVLLNTLAGGGTASFGGVLFAILTWLSLAGALGAGIFLTADCLSEEKREGTLGFLFLTDLRGYDVILGKLLATSLRGFYALLAVLPVLSVTLLMGGVTGAQFGKTSLALVHALFFSLAAGLLISSISRDSQKALAGTFLLLLLLTAGGPIIDWLQSQIGGRAFRPCFSLASPVYVFMSAGAWGRSPYWNGLLFSEFIAWLTLGLGCILIPWTWQERAQRTSGAGAGWRYHWKYGGTKRRQGLHRLLDANPAMWLACRERWQAFALWSAAFLVLGSGIALWLTASQSPIWFALNGVSGVVSLALYLWIASQACRFFVETRRSGLIELLLTTPLDNRQIVQGHWRALLRMFGLPVLLLLTFQAMGSWVGLHAAWTSLTPTAGVIAPNRALSITTAVLPALAGAANLVALIWFGMWMGMTSRNTSLATLKSIAFVQVIPWFLLSFLSSMIMIFVMIRPGLKGGGGATSTVVTTNAASVTVVTSTTMVTRMTVWFPLFNACLAALLNAAKDAGFFFWARKRLYLSFRQEAARTERDFIAGASRAASPVMPPPMTAAPPVIAGEP